MSQLSSVSQSKTIPTDTRIRMSTGIKNAGAAASKSRVCSLQFLSHHHPLHRHQDILGFAHEIPIILHLSQQVLSHSSSPGHKSQRQWLWFVTHGPAVAAAWDGVEKSFSFCLHFKGKYLKECGSQEAFSTCIFVPWLLLCCVTPCQMYPKSPLNSNLSLAQGNAKLEWPCWIISLNKSKQEQCLKPYLLKIFKLTHTSCIICLFHQ